MSPAAGAASPTGAGRRGRRQSIRRRQTQICDKRVAIMDRQAMEWNGMGWNGMEWSGMD